MLNVTILILLLIKLSSAELNLENIKSNIIEYGVDKDDECYKKYWDLKMLDSSSKLIPTGIMSGNVFDLGSYDQCTSIKNEDIYGKYCLVSISIEKLLEMLKPHKKNETLTMLAETEEKLKEIVDTKLFGIATDVKELFVYLYFVKLGICIPDKCNMNNLGKYLPIDANRTVCYTKFTNSEMDTGALIVLIIIYAFIVIALISTAFDVYYEICDGNKSDVLTSFSLLTNGKKLMQYSKNSEQLGCLHGIRTFSMMWVIIGHTYLNMSVSVPINNFFDINHWLDDPMNMFVLSATVSVDTFFTMSGLLAVYSFMKLPEKSLNASFMNIPFLYLHRYLRLTPAFLIMIIAYSSGLIKYIGDGPRWSLLDSSIKHCSDNWWAALLYIQNYIGFKNFCITQSWYLSADFQLFLITPFILIPLKKWPKYVLPILYCLTFGGLIYPFYIGFTNKISGVGEGSGSHIFIDDYYFATHVRFSTYTIGMITGYYIYKLKARRTPFTLSLVKVVLFWILSIGGLIFCVFDGFKLVKNGNNPWIDGIYMGFNRAGWSLATSLLILLCATGYGGPVNKMLSSHMFQFISRLSYSMYLTHYIVILATNASLRTSVHFSNFTTITMFISYFVITLGVSTIYCLLFESPFIKIEKLIFSGGKKKASTN